MSPSEIAFLSVGLIIGAAVGAAMVEALRARPAPRRQVRLTIAPNTIPPRRSATLATPVALDMRSPMPGSPEDGAWPEAPGPGLAPRPAAAALAPTFTLDPVPTRTRVPSMPVQLSATAIGIPVEGGAAVMPLRRSGYPSAVLARDTGPSDARMPAPAAVATAVALAILEPVAEPAALPSTFDVGEPLPNLVVTSRGPGPDVRPTLRQDVVPVAVIAVHASLGEADDAGSPPPVAASPSSETDPCSSSRTVVEERCALAGAARDHARTAAETLHEAQRAYDILRERLDQAQAAADPREIAAAKDELHRRFREASESAFTADHAEAAAREWLNAINDLNARAREATRFLDAGSAELRAAMPGLERLGVEADAARIGAENAEASCHEARERLAACEEQVERAAILASAERPADEPHPFDALWPAEHEPTFGTVDPTASEAVAPAGDPLVLRMLRGDRAARDRLIAHLAGGDPEATRDWQLKLTALMDAIIARSIEAGYLDLPDGDRFWGMFEHRERREIVAALSALGFRFDGLGGFADGRAPAARDLSLAVGYAGLDRMRIRAWPQESDLATLYEHALVAADEWLADQADDLALGRMVDALGSRAGDLADVWNAWGRMRPALLATD